MAKRNTITRHLDNIRKLVRKKQNDTEATLRREFELLLQKARQYLGEEFALLSENGLLDYSTLNRKGQLERFLSRIEGVLAAGTTSVSGMITSLVEDAYTMSYKGMVEAANLKTKNKILSKVVEKTFLRPEILKQALTYRMKPLQGFNDKQLKVAQKRLRKELVNGLLKGERMDAIAGRVRDRIGVTYRRSVMIARTEVHRVQEAGFYDVAKDLDKIYKATSREAKKMPKVPEPMESVTPAPTGALQPAEIRNLIRLEQEETGELYMDIPEFNQTKTWRSMQDERVRRTKKANHRKLDGQKRAVDEDFDLGRGVKASRPGSSGDPSNDINCRCIAAYDIEIT